MLNRRTQIRYRDFICKGDDHHAYRGVVALETSDDGGLIERSASFGTGREWSGLPICPICNALAEERATYDPSMAAIPEAERFQAWLSPDGKRVAVPGKRNAQMPERYLVAGYRTIEAQSMRDFDRIEHIRAEQTGNDVVSEMNYSAEERKWHDDAPYDPDSMTT